MELNSAFGTAHPDKPLDVLIVGAHEQSLYSMQRHTQMLAAAYRASGLSVRLVRPPSVLYRRVNQSKWAAYADKFLVFPLRLFVLARRAKVVHVADHSDAILGLFLGKQTWIVSCHDLNAVMAASNEFEGVEIRLLGRLYQRLVVRGLRRATALTCISHATAADLHRVAGRTGVVAPLPLDPIFRSGQMNLEEVGDFALIVASPSWRKAREQGIQAWLHLRSTAPVSGLSLRIVGGPLTPKESELVHSRGAIAAVQVLSGLSDEQLMEQYENCAFLIMMSRAEGLGWPVVEAGAKGRVSACSDIPVLRETGGESGVYIPDDFEVNWEELAAQLISPSRRSAAKTNSERFDSEQFARSIHNVWAGTFIASRRPGGRGTRRR